MKVGVLGLQGDVREHAAALERGGATPVVVKRPHELDAADALVVPGGESTTIGKLLAASGLLEGVRSRVSSGMPLFGTCAGMILMAASAVGDHPVEHSFGAMDVTVRRNGYGRQAESFEADLDIVGMEGPFRAVFIRAPVVESVGEDVEVLATWDEAPVLVRQGSLLASSFHPEMTGDVRVHELFVSMVERG